MFLKTQFLQNLLQMMAVKDAYQKHSDDSESVCCLMLASMSPDLKYKSEVFEKFKEYKSEVENQLGKSIKVLRSDRGGEYLSQEFQDYLKENGILSQWTPPYTPQLNGVSERRNRTLLDMVRSMMSHANLPKSFWGYSLNIPSYLLNHAPSKAVDSSPYEIWYKRKPNLKHLKVWGCPVFVKESF